MNRVRVNVYHVYNSTDNVQDKSSVVAFRKDFKLNDVAHYFEEKLFGRKMKSECDVSIHIWCRLRDIKQIYPISGPQSKITVNLSEIEQLDMNKWMEVPYDYLSNIKLTKNMELLIEHIKILETSKEASDDSNNNDDSKIKDLQWPLGKSSDKWKNFEIGDIIDCIDSNGEWREAMIRNIVRNGYHCSIAVHYIGKSLKYDEWIDFEMNTISSMKPRVSKRNSFTNIGLAYQDISLQLFDCNDSSSLNSEIDNKCNNEYERNECTWICKNKNNTITQCDELTNKTFNNLRIGFVTCYFIDNDTYKATKLSSNCIEEINLDTNKKRIFYEKRTLKIVVLWKFINQDGNVTTCGKHLCDKLNQVNIGNSIKYNVNSDQYIATRLNNDIMEQINIKTKTKRFLYRSEISKKEKENYYETRFSNDKELIGIAKKFHKTVDYRDFEIINIEKCDNDNEMYKMVYGAILKAKKQKNGNKQIEKMLFYPIATNSLKKILKNGFNRDFNQRKKFGNGVYFARDAQYSVGHCDSCAVSGVQRILACKVLIGDYCQGDASMITPPDKPNEIDQYEMMVNDINTPSIYVVAKDYHAIPAFIITFNKRVLL